jgi:hypothetical protein
MSAPELLATAVRELAFATDLGTVTSIVRRAARRVSGADGVTFVLRDGSECYYVDEDAIAPLWKGRRFRMAECISGWVIRHGRAVAIPDVYQDDRIPHDAYRPTFVKALAMVPVRPQDPVAAIGAYWAREHLASEEELAAMRVLADASSTALAAIDSTQRLARRRRARDRPRRPAGRRGDRRGPSCGRVRATAGCRAARPGPRRRRLPSALRPERPVPASVQTPATSGRGTRCGSRRTGEEVRRRGGRRPCGRRRPPPAVLRAAPRRRGAAPSAVGAFLDVTQRNRAQQALPPRRSSCTS